MYEQEFLETHAGGALAVAGHCSGLGAEVSLISGLHSSDLSHSVVKQIQAQGIHTMIHRDGSKADNS